MKNIKVLDYGAGNVGSIITAFTKIGYPPSIALTEKDILSADLLVIPGVGSAKAAITSMQKENLKETLNERHTLKKPLLGICLGAQLLFHYLEEADGIGLSWFPGDVKSLGAPLYFNNGWCHLDSKQFKESGLSRGLGETSTFYFNHQYFFPMSKSYKSISILELEGKGAICLKDHLCGIQFHPEKSQKSGSLILRNILEDHYGF